MEQGSAERGAGAPFGDATVQPIMSASFQCRSHARLRGQIPEGPSSARRRAPVSGDATGEEHNSTRAISGAASRSGVASIEEADGTCSALRVRGVGMG